jgi:acetyl-CoA acyltransferase
MREALIVGAARTAIGKSPRGTLRYTRPDDLAAVAIQAAIERAGGIEPGEIEDVILGCAQPEMEQGMNVARIAALRAGLPMTVPGLTVNRFCASGLEAIAIGAQRIACGSADIIVAGGTESMSMVNFLGSSTRPNPSLIASHPDTYLSMGLCVEQLSKRYGISREQADVFSAGSHDKALAAQGSGRFAEEVVPVPVRVQEMNGGGGPEIRETAFGADECPRSGTTVEVLGRLKPAFRADGIVTAGNASQRSDGAAAVVLVSAERAEHLGLKPLLRFVGYAVAAVEPENFGIGPAFAIPKLLRQVKLGIEDVELIEFNEAFAAQVLCSNKEFVMPLDRVNVNGGAIALGHPLGCTGARQTVTLASEMARRRARYGMVTMCAALGMGAAGLFERV